MKKIMPLLVILVFLSTSCSHVRMKYNADYDTTGGKSGKVELVNSYKVGTIRTMCFITGILYGGACWLYLMTPFHSHKMKVKHDAEEMLANELGGASVSVYNESYAQIGYDEDKPEYNNSEFKGTKKSHGVRKTTPSVPMKKKQVIDGFIE